MRDCWNLFHLPPEALDPRCQCKSKLESDAEGHIERVHNYFKSLKRAN
jgi:hypothetical protein